MSVVSRERAGAGSALTNTARQVSGALGVAVLGSVLAQAYRSQLSPHLGNLPASARNAATGSITASQAASRSSRWTDQNVLSAGAEGPAGRCPAPALAVTVMTGCIPAQLRSRYQAVPPALAQPAPRPAMGIGGSMQCGREMLWKSPLIGRQAGAMVTGEAGNDRPQHRGQRAPYDRPPTNPVPAPMLAKRTYARRSRSPLCREPDRNSARSYQEGKANDRAP
jgi:hypothetical protein